MTSINAELFHREYDRNAELPCLCGHSRDHHDRHDRCRAEDCSCRRYDADHELEDEA